MHNPNRQINCAVCFLQVVILFLQTFHAIIYDTERFAWNESFLQHAATQQHLFRTAFATVNYMYSIYKSNAHKIEHVQAGFMWCFLCAGTRNSQQNM